jgi:hypothetical protein
MKTQQITAILKTAGYKATKVVWQDGRKVTIGDYRVRKFGNEIGIDCCFCQDKMNDIISLLNSSGFEAKEKFAGGAMLQVTKA